MREDPRERRHRWELTGDAFEKLLAALDPNRDRAAERYETLRRKLMKFFVWRGCAMPEALVDETLNRVARRVDEGERIQDVPRYVLGVARLVARETFRELRREQEACEIAVRETVTASESLERERLDRCTEACLAELPPESRRLIVEYYLADKRAKIEGRRELAGRLGIPANALRIRAHRIRARIAECIRRCLDDSG